MFRPSKCFFVSLAILSFSAVYAGTIPNTDNPRTFVGPSLNLSYSTLFDESTGYSVLAATGVKNNRLGVTIGLQLMEQQRVKLSAEYLIQKITYPFFSGNTDQWVNQGAVGLGYQYDMYEDKYHPIFNVNAYYSHAPSKTLSAISGMFINSMGVVNSYVDTRRIAGSTAVGAESGVILYPWLSTQVDMEVNYDNVDYDKNYPPNEDGKGFGGTLRIKQELMQGVTFDGSAAIRQPFNSYTAGLYWQGPLYFANWRIGIMGVYTAGKSTLPSTYDAVLTLDYIAEVSQTNALQTLSQFVATPAVHIPQILAMPEEQVTTTPTL